MAKNIEAPKRRKIVVIAGDGDFTYECTGAVVRDGCLSIYDVIDGEEVFVAGFMSWMRCEFADEAVLNVAGNCLAGLPCHYDRNSDTPRKCTICGETQRLGDD